MTGRHHLSVSWWGTVACFDSRDVPLCRVVFPADLTDTVQDTVKHPPNEYSSFNEHFNRSFRTRAGWLHATAAIPPCRHEVWPFPEAALHLSVCLLSEGQIDLWRAKQTTWPPHFLIMHHRDLLPRARDLVHKRLIILLHFSFAC